MAKLAKTVFESGPDDNLATDDVYRGPGRPRNVPVDSDTPAALDAQGRLKEEAVEGNRESSIRTRDVVKAVNAGLVGRNDPELSRRASKAVGDTGAFSTLPRGLRDDILSDLSGGAIGGRGSVRSTVGGSSHLLRTDQLDDARGISNFLVDLTGNDAIAQTADIEGEMAIFNGVLKSAIDLGFVEVIDTFWERAKDKERARQSLINSLRLLALRSNLEGIRKVVGIIGRQEALAREPKLIQFIVTFYQLPPGSSRPDYDGLLTELTDTLDLVDPKWHLYDRKGRTVSSLEPFVFASQDAKTLFQRNPEWRVVSLVGPAYTREDILQLAQRTYPNAGL